MDGVLLDARPRRPRLGTGPFGFEAVHTHDLPVHATPRLAAYLRQNGPWARMVGRDEIALREMEPGVPFELDDGVQVTPILVPHRDEDSDTVGFRIRGPRRSVLYVPDTDGWSAWTTPLRDVLSGCDVALLDGTFMSADELPGRDVRTIRHPLIPATMDLLQDVVAPAGCACTSRT